MSARLWWIGVILLDAVLWGVVLAIPAVILVLPNQWQGDSPTVPVEIIVRAALSQAAAPFATAALALSVVLIVAGVQHRRPRPEPQLAREDGEWAEAELVDR